MTVTETHPPTKTTPPSHTWVNATWEEFIAFVDDPANEKATCYYWDNQMRIETTGVGPDHAVDNTLLTLAIGLFCMLKGIKVRGLTNASYRKPGNREAQPDASYYVNDNALLVPQGNTIIDLETHPSPDLAIEIAATSLNDDLGVKRLLYEELGVREYWVVNVETAQILAFQILVPEATSQEFRGSQRITISNVLPGLEIATLEVALASRKTQDDSKIMAALMTQFSAEMNG